MTTTLCLHYNCCTHTALKHLHCYNCSASTTSSAVLVLLCGFWPVTCRGSTSNEWEKVIGGSRGPAPAADPPASTRSPPAHSLPMHAIMHTHHHE